MSTPEDTPTPDPTVIRSTFGTLYRVDVYGAFGRDRKAAVRAGTEARRWARELGKRAVRAERGGYTSRNGRYGYTVLYRFED